MIHEPLLYLNVHQSKMAENSILKAALGQFREATGCRFAWKDDPEGVVLELGASNGPFRTLVRNELREHHLGGLLEEIGREQERTLLVTQYVSKPLRARLRQSGIRYLDASGNCYIRAGHSVLFVDERKVSRQRRSGLSGLWKPTGLRFLFTVLVKPEVLQADYRTIAVACRLSLGTVAGLMQELERSPYFKKVKGVWQVNDRESLLARWLDHYHSHLRPRLRQARYRFAQEHWRKHWAQLDVSDAYWSGEPAGPCSPITCGRSSSASSAPGAPVILHEDCICFRIPTEKWKSCNPSGTPITYLPVRCTPRRFCSSMLSLWEAVTVGTAPSRSRFGRNIMSDASPVPLDQATLELLADMEPVLRRMGVRWFLIGAIAGTCCCRKQFMHRITAEHRMSTLLFGCRMKRLFNP